MAEGEDQPANRDAMMFMGNAIASHTNEVRSMHWVQIYLFLTLLFVIASANIGQLGLTLMIYQQEKERHAEFRELRPSPINENHNVNIMPRGGGLFEDAAEAISRNRKIENAR